MSETEKGDVVSLDKVGDHARDKVKYKKQDERADALKLQFQRAMGWTPEKGGKKDKVKRKKKRS